MSVAAAVILIWLFTLITVAIVVYAGSSPEINCSVALFIIALPLVGAVIYLLARHGRKSKAALKINGATPQNGIENAVLKNCGICGADYDRAEYFKCGEQYFNLLFKEISKAKKCVYLEYFIICRGEIFNRLIASLKTANANGAEIKIITDGIGSAFKLGKKEIKKLKAAGAELKIFHRISPFGYTRLNFRDHRKIAVIDGKAAFTGGYNIADEYANIASPYGYWKDSGVAVYGNAAKVFEGMFLSVWNGSCEIDAVNGGKYRCIPFYDSPPDFAGFCENIYVQAISSAKKAVHIFTPYFCPSEKIRSALQFSAERGVDVRIIIPHIPDKKYAFELSKACALPLAYKGVKFYEYTPGFMHAKSMVCDDTLYIGSYNFDFRSMRLNYECGVMMTGEMCDCAERDFWECLRLSSPLCEDRLTPFKRIKAVILKLFAPLM